MRTFLLLLLAFAVVVVARWSLYTVDAGEYAYVTLLGRPIATYDGADSNEASTDASSEAASDGSATEAGPQDASNSG